MPAARTPDYRPISTLFKALANPVRIATVHLLSDWERAVDQLVEALGLPQPLVSQHLRVLHGALVVAIRWQGQEIWYGVCGQHVAHILDNTMKHTQEGEYNHNH